MSSTPSTASSQADPQAKQAPAAAPAKKKRRFPSFSVQILLGLAVGVGLGALALAMGPQDAAGDVPNGLTTTLDTVGSSFVTLLKAVVPPLIFTAIVASIANLRTVTNAARLAGQTLLWFAITAAISVAVGIGLGLLFQPGNRASVSLDAASEPGRTGTWLDFLNGLIPGNVLGLGASTSLETGDDGALTGAASTSVSFNVLQILVVALVIGIAALKSGKKADPFLAFNRSALAIVQKVLWWIIRLAPIGTAGLIGYAIAAYGWTSLASLAWFAVAIYVGLAVVLFVVYPILLR
ncbi:MAG: dicarboxylate/amino acid:cation symporter, partial [Cellulosimicrobium funkei]